jgi:hypothetical protein
MVGQTTLRAGYARQDILLTGEKFINIHAATNWSAREAVERG